MKTMSYSELKAVKRKFYRELTQSFQGLPKVYLSQSDFNTGTYRIQTPGIYILLEDIVFNPNPENDYKPYPNDPRYSQPPKLAGTTYSKPFSLGFFAAITVECTQVCIDLNGHSIAQSQAHALQQRFYANIDLASTPFLPNQGPGDFGPTIHPGKRCWIKNGTLGLSSHHGIHGNNSSAIIIENLIIRDFEVAGVALNGGSLLFLRNLKIGPARHDIPVMATYSAARFLLQFSEALLKMKLLSPTLQTAVQAKQDRLTQAMTKVFQEVMATGKTTDPIFHNPSGLLDGLIYGVLIHPPGVAINDFVDNNFNGKFSENVFLSNIQIADIRSKADEVVGVSLADGTGEQIDPTNSVFRITEVTAPNGTYQGNVLTDLQIAFAQAVQSLGDKLPPGAQGKLTITPDLVTWATTPGMTLNDLFHLPGKKYHYKCGSDSMLHLAKGNVGFRLDGVRSFIMKKCFLATLINTGPLGSEIAGPYRLSQDKQERPGYRGADCTGINFSRCSHGYLKELALANIRSYNGEARGIRLINSCNHLIGHKVLIDSISAGEKQDNGVWLGSKRDGTLVAYTGELPNMVPAAIGIKIEDPCHDIKIPHLAVANLTAPGEIVAYWQR
jgi:hypothetical protein